MKPSGYYTSGEFAKMAKVTIRTIRFYDKKNLLKPSFVSPSGVRYYSDSDFVKLQQVLLFKYLGFSLDDIKELTINHSDTHFMQTSLSLQKRLIQDRIEQMQFVERALDDTLTAIRQDQQIDWNSMLELIHLTSMEKSLKTQYQNATNISTRIRLHKEYSQNPQGWFPWIYEHCGLEPGMDVLELGCGNGSLWQENLSLLPEHISICLSDISDGMLRDARRNLGTQDDRFRYENIDCHSIPYPDHTFDLVIANHLFFYCQDIPRVLREILRILKPDGKLICSTYGKNHMKEISQLVQKFDNRILLSAENLYEHFGLENGETYLTEFFSDICCEKYEDSIFLTHSEPLIEYILSCHGNQNQILLEKYSDFRAFVDKSIGNGFHITKDAGIFICKK